MGVVIVCTFWCGDGYEEGRREGFYIVEDRGEEKSIATRKLKQRGTILQDYLV